MDCVELMFKDLKSYILGKLISTVWQSPLPAMFSNSGSDKEKGDHQVQPWLVNITEGKRGRCGKEMVIMLESEPSKEV